MALGRDFDRLHPALRERYGFNSSTRCHSVGIGVMERIWSGSRIFAPFLHLGAQRNIMFPESGEDVPFRIECWAYKDSHGRETLSLNRSFEMKRTLRFDEYIVAIPATGDLIIYAGNHQHLAVELDVSVSSSGGLELRTGAQRLMTPVGAWRFPLLFSAEAVVHEWYEASSGRFRIDGRVRNRILGDVFGCVGFFESHLEPDPGSGIPAGVRPLREETRS